MPKKTSTKETVAAAPARTAAKPRVKTVKHSKAAVVEVETVNVTVSATAGTHDQIAKIAYGYWAARNFEAGSPEQDWLRAEQEFLDTRR